MRPFALGPFIPDGRFPALSLTAQSSLSSTCPPSQWRACNLSCRAGDQPLFLQLTISNPLSSFPHATSQTLLAKFKQQHEDNRYFLGTPVMEPAFIIQHFAGKVKYQIKVCIRPRRQERDHRGDVEAPSLWYLVSPSPLSVVLGEVLGCSDSAVNPQSRIPGPESPAPQAGTTLCYRSGPCPTTSPLCAGIE